MQEVARRAVASADPRSGAGKRDTPSKGVEGLLRDQDGASLAALRFRPRSGVRQGYGPDLLRTARPRHALDRPRHGQKPSASACAPCSACGRRIGCSRTAFAPSSAPNDPEFAEKVEDSVGLYMDPPKHTVVVSIDEKSQIQALDRTQPGLPLKPRKMRDDDP